MNDFTWVLNWMKKNVGKTYRSPREIFSSKPSTIKIVAVYEDKVTFDFVEKKTRALPLYFWMFDRTLQYLISNRDRYIILGARVQPPYGDDTVEGEIWREPYPYSSSPFKISPHICDYIVLSGLAEYGYVTNPKKGRPLQGIKYTGIQSGLSPESVLEDIDMELDFDERTEFFNKYKQAITEWAEINRYRIPENRLKYRWGNKPTSECVQERNEVSKAIIISRIKNGGGIDLGTLDKITKWGFNRVFPLRDPEKALKVTKVAFNYLDDSNLINATKTLLDLEGVGISRASKVLGLFDQESQCIYDSRVGHALKDLKYDNKKIILCPPGYNRPGNAASNNDWAEQYQRLIWTLEIIRDHLNTKGHTFRIADIEMALFMMGK